MSSTVTSPPSSFPLVLMQPLLLVFNYLLRQGPWAQETLRPFTGRMVRFDLTPMSMTLQVNAAGLVIAPAPDAEPAVAAVALLAAVAGDYATGGQAAVLKHVCIEGEAEFVNVLSTLLRNLRWDAVEDLSRVFGDVIAQRTVSDAQAARIETTRVSHSPTESTALYLTDEQPALVRHARLAQFTADVAALRDAEARLVKRLERLEKLPRPATRTACQGESA